VAYLTSGRVGNACGSNETQQQECIHVQEQLDEHLFSWTDYGDSQGEKWEVAAVQQKNWARTYARIIAGTPLNMSFEIASPLRRFKMCYAFGRGGR
jgi:hypothetical protein